MQGFTYLLLGSTGSPYEGQRYIGAHTGKSCDGYVTGGAIISNSKDIDLFRRVILYRGSFHFYVEGELLASIRNREAYLNKKYNHQISPDKPCHKFPQCSSHIKERLAPEIERLSVLLHTKTNHWWLRASHDIQSHSKGRGEAHIFKAYAEMLHSAK